MSNAMKATLLPVSERMKGFEAVEKGFSSIQASMESNRCLLCDDAPCTKGCPAGIDVRGFIRKIRFGDNRGGIRLLREENIFAGVCGRVCPTETLCEGECSSQALSDPIRIGSLQRYLSDWEMESGRREFDLPEANLKPVAVIGAGVAGLAASAGLRQLGHPVTVYEKDSYAGGVLVDGIPRFKLPRSVVDYEIDLIRDMGVEIKLSQGLGKGMGYAELQEKGFGAILVTVGLQEPNMLSLKGEDLEGVYSEVELLQAANGFETDRKISIGKEVAVIGGGSASVNVACSALRMGAETVTITALGTPAEMDAFNKDKQQGLDEGVQFCSRMRPLDILGENGHVTGLEGVRVDWIVPGKFVPGNTKDLPGSRIVLPADTVILAVGRHPEKIEKAGLPELETTPNGYLVVNDETGMTSHEGIFAAGDILGGRRTVVQSIDEGKRTAEAIHEYMKD